MLADAPVRSQPLPGLVAAATGAQSGGGNPFAGLIAQLLRDAKTDPGFLRQSLPADMPSPSGDYHLQAPDGQDLFGLLSQFAKSKGASIMPLSGGAGSGRLGNWIGQALSDTNTPASEARGLRTLIQNESGGDPHAYNPTPVGSGQHAQGLAQTIPSTFQEYAMRGHGNINNPIDNLIAAIRYIKADYGSVYNTPGLVSLSHGGSYKGY